MAHVEYRDRAEIEDVLAGVDMERRTDGWYSDALRFLHYLINWQDAEVRVPRLPIRDYLGKNRPIFGSETMEMRGWTRSQLGAFVNGNMFMGLFGSDVGVKLDGPDHSELAAVPGAGPFGTSELPMAGYVTLPAGWTAREAVTVITIRST